MRAITRRALGGEIRTNRTVALASICSLGSPLTHRARALGAGVAAERPRRRELAELVADHRLADVDRDVLASVVHRDRVPDHLGDDRGPARPGLDDALVAAAVHLDDLDHQVVVDERPLLHGPRHQPRPFPRRRTINLSDGLPFLRVRPSGLPHGDVGWRPPELLPSPPPSGWSTGFIATPRTDGRLPFQRLRPALPSCTSSCSALPTSPTAALHATSIMRISPLGSRTVANRPSLATSWTLAPAERAILAPPPGLSSMAWITVPTGMLRSGSALPGRISAFSPDISLSPTDRPAGAR